jgi:hypothetical protein
MAKCFHLQSVYKIYRKDNFLYVFWPYFISANFSTLDYYRQNRNDPNNNEILQIYYSESIMHLPIQLNSNSFNMSLQAECLKYRHSNQLSAGCERNNRGERQSLSSPIFVA